MKRLQLVHPILAAAYVQYGAERTLEEGVEMIRLFARAVYSLDEYESRSGRHHRTGTS